MFDFPNSPILNQIAQNPASGASWQWDGVKWGPVQSGGWVDAPADGNTYGRKNNAWNSVDAMVAPALNDTGRNLIHNAQMAIAQRGVGPWTTDNTYTLDRWLTTDFGSLDTISFSRIALADADRAAIGDESAVYGMQNVFTGNAGATAMTFLIQHTESVRRLANKTVTVSFWAKAAAGTPKLGVNISQVFGTGGSPSTGLWVAATGSATPALTANFVRYSFTFALPSVAGKTLGTNGDDYTGLAFFYSSGANNNAAAGNIGVQSGTVQIWGVQLEIGSVATPLAKRDPADDLALCQRFYQLCYFGIDGYGLAGGTFGTMLVFPVQMRATPTVTLNVGGAGNCGSPSSAGYGPNTQGFKFTAIVTATGGAYWNGNFTASADL